MAKKNIGTLLLVFLVLLGVIGVSSYYAHKNGSDAEAGSSQMDGEEWVEQVAADPKIQEKIELIRAREKPEEFSLEYAEDFSMDELNMTIDELNQLKTYRIKLCTDPKGYMDQAAEALLGDLDQISISAAEPTGMQGYGSGAKYQAQDGSQVYFADIYDALYVRGTMSEEVKDTDYEKEIHAWQKALEAGFKGYDGVTYSIMEPYILYGENNLKYDIQYYIDGYPISRAVDFDYEPDEEGYVYWRGGCSGSFVFENGWMMSIDWTPPMEIYADDRISRQYESMDKICEQMEEAMENQSDSNDCYIITGVHCSYVIGYTYNLKENGMRELIAAPFLEFETVSGRYYPITDTWGVVDNHVIGFNLENGTVNDAQLN